MFSVYLIFLTLSASVSLFKNLFISRVTSLVVVAYQLFILDSLLHWHGDVVFLDGLCKINVSILTSEIFLLVQVLALIHLHGIYSKRPEFYLLILSNVLGLIYLISSNDWLITVVAWELVNLSLYLLISVSSLMGAIYAYYYYY